MVVSKRCPHNVYGSMATAVWGSESGYSACASGRIGRTYSGVARRRVRCYTYTTMLLFKQRDARRHMETHEDTRRHMESHEPILSVGTLKIVDMATIVRNNSDRYEYTITKITCSELQRSLLTHTLYNSHTGMLYTAARILPPLLYNNLWASLFRTMKSVGAVFDRV